ncbi:hypothetical protein GCM10009724_26750 [Microbacterium lacticum]|nr:hypothetical protein MLA01_26380 [Microbacterium lacticum]GGI74390.1 hypothetical protein GCM10009724_26750 [Microbacterium lacticum]
MAKYRPEMSIAGTPHFRPRRERMRSSAMLLGRQVRSRPRVATLAMKMFRNVAVLRSGDAATG